MLSVNNSKGGKDKCQQTSGVEDIFECNPMICFNQRPFRLVYRTTILNINVGSIYLAMTGSVLQSEQTVK